MKILKVKRKSRYENRYHENMGLLICKVVKIQLLLFNFIPVKTYYQYRETYNGEIKELKNCQLHKINK